MVQNTRAVVVRLGAAWFPVVVIVAIVAAAVVVIVGAVVIVVVCARSNDGDMVAAWAPSARDNRYTSTRQRVRITA
jgi:hypothetical protein